MWGYKQTPKRHVFFRNGTGLRVKKFMSIILGSIPNIIELGEEGPI